MLSEKYLYKKESRSTILVDRDKLAIPTGFSFDALWSVVVIQRLFFDIPDNMSV